MDAGQTKAQSEVTSDVDTKRRQKRIKKLAPDEMAGLPGVTPRAVKVEATDETFSIVFNIKLGNEIGNTNEATRCYTFAESLDQQAKAKSIGKVTSARFENGNYEAVLTLDVDNKISKNDIPFKNAFAQLHDFFAGAEILRTGVAGSSAIWRGRVRNTNVVEGHF